MERLLAHRFIDLCHLSMRNLIERIIQIGNNMKMIKANRRIWQITPNSRLIGITSANPNNLNPLSLIIRETFEKWGKTFLRPSLPI